MDWLRQIPIGQYVDGSAGWLRLIDPRLKLGWVVMFLLTPVLAGPLWRLGLVLALMVITALSGLPATTSGGRTSPAEGFLENFVHN